MGITFKIRRENNEHWNRNIENVASLVSTALCEVVHVDMMRVGGLTRCAQLIQHWFDVHCAYTLHEMLSEL